MKKSFYTRLALVLVILAASIYYLYPTFRLMMMPEPDKQKLSLQSREKLENSAINLGLDLKGGMYLVMEVDMEKLNEEERKDALDRALEIIRNRIDQFGVAEPLIQKQGDKRIIVQLPGLQDPKRAKNLIGQTALLEFKLVREGQDAAEVLTRIDQVTAENNLLEKYNILDLQEKSDDTTQIDDSSSNVSVLEQLTSPKNDTAAAGDTTLEGDSAQAATDTSLTKDSSNLLNNLTQTKTEGQNPVLSRIISRPTEHFTNFFVKQENFRIIDSLLKTPEIQAAIPIDMEVLWSSESEIMGNNESVRQLYVVTKSAEMTGASVADAKPTIGQGYDPSISNRPIVEFKVKDEAVKLFARITGSNLNKRLGIILDHKVVSAPELIVKIRDGQSIITGSKDINEAKDLAIVLRSGALPAPVSVIEERTVGPSMGSDSINAGKKSAMIGFILVAIFMIFYYKLSGAIADLALVLAMFFILAAMAYLHATLTLPGIAGLVLTMGMAVDANVLIFERIREELNSGKTSIASVENGFGRAFWTIFDSNITTLLTGLVLYTYGTGPIKGFAVTLSLGIIFSMFTALVICKLIFETIVYRVKPKTLSI